jgi:acyl dehydratase
VARQVGFERPILHGLCTYGLACRAVLRACCDYDPSRILSFDARLGSPVFPGDALMVRLWKDDGIIFFECSVPDRSVTVMRSGRCEIA